jgi:hypothetical protein
MPIISFAAAAFSLSAIWVGECRSMRVKQKRAVREQCEELDIEQRVRGIESREREERERWIRG